MQSFYAVLALFLITLTPSSLAQYGGTTSSCSSLFRYSGSYRSCGACMENYYSTRDPTGSQGGSTACTTCPAGSSSTRGQTTCSCTAPNSSLQNGVCVCNSGAYSQGSGTTLKCTVCPTSQPAYDSASSTCYACPANSNFSSTSRTCVCNSGANAQGSGKSLSCVVCPANSHFDTTANACVCNTNTESSGSGSTLACKNCQDSQLAFDSTTQKCFKCPSVASPSGNTCTCPAEYNYYDSTRNACVKSMTRPSPDVYTYRKRNFRRHQTLNSLPGVKLSPFSEKFGHKCSSPHQVACSTGRKNSFECINVLTSLESCGGCPDSPSFKDCTTIEGASQVSCEKGKCVVSACDLEYSLKSGTCVRKA